MNQSVFGSSFETIRISRVANNAIETDLVILDSAIKMSYEEMEYIDGRKTFMDFYLSNSQTWSEDIRI